MKRDKSTTTTTTTTAAKTFYSLNTRDCRPTKYKYTRQFRL